MKHFKPSMRYDFISGLAVANDPKPPKKKSEASALTEKIISHLKGEGHYANRLQSTGIMADGRFVKSNQKAGLPDVMAVVNGRFVGFEIKIGADKPRLAQLQTKEQIEKSRGVYEFVSEFGEFLKIYAHLSLHG